MPIGYPLDINNSSFGYYITPSTLYYAFTKTKTKYYTTTLTNGTVNVYEYSNNVMSLVGTGTVSDSSNLKYNGTNYSYSSGNNVTIYGTPVWHSGSLILQWGTIFLTSNPQTISFPTSWNTTYYHITIGSTYRQSNDGWSATLSPRNYAYGTYTTSSFFAKSTEDSLWDYIAIGY